MTKKNSNPTKQWRPFEEAREFARSLNLKSIAEWRAYCNSGNKPANIPSAVAKVYKNEGWISWPDWLGTRQGEPKRNIKKWVSLDVARDFALSLNLKSLAEWLQYCKDHRTELAAARIPLNPSAAYRNQGWICWSDFLGTGRVKVQWLPFEEAREFVRALNLKSQLEWNAYRKSGSKPANIPGDPARTYRNDGWISWPDWLGKKPHIWMPFEEAREFARSLNLKTMLEWDAYCESGNKPSNIPSTPECVYKNDGWKGWDDFLGNQWLPFEEAREFVRSLNLKSGDEWIAYSKSGNRPANIPSAPHTVYKNDGWISWPDWLGTTRIRMSFEEAREFARPLNFKSQSEWIAYCQSGNKPANIPIYPNSAYKNDGWKDWKDFLGDQWMPFEEAREFVRALNLKNQSEWLAYCQSGSKPANIPNTPACVYKNDGWISWLDWLGTRPGAPKRNIMNSMPFEEARKFARALNLKSQSEWLAYCQSGSKPANIPINPGAVYKNDGWKGWADFLGYEGNRNISKELSEFLNEIWPIRESLDEGAWFMLLRERGLDKEAQKRLKCFSMHDTITSLCTDPNVRAKLEEWREEAIVVEPEPTNAEAAPSIPVDDELPELPEDRAEEYAPRLNVDAFKALDTPALADAPPSVIEWAVQKLLTNLRSEYLQHGEERVRAILDTFPKGPNFTKLSMHMEVDLRHIRELKVPEWRLKIGGEKKEQTRMQKYIAVKMKEVKVWGNWSGTGAGKTGSAGLAAFAINSQLTLVIAANSNVDQWKQGLDDCFSGTKVAFEVEDARHGRGCFLVLNYDRFSQPTARSLVKQLVALKPDFIVLDEVALVKQRGIATKSKRRKQVLSLRNRLPKAKVLAMSASPVINDLNEPVSLLSLMMNKARKSMCAPQSRTH